jgi:arylsulfatase A-like enzyme
MRGCSWSSLFGAAIFAVWAACSKKDPPTPPAPPPVVSVAPSASVALAPPDDFDVILITIDCLRADMPWNGYERPIAPRLTELAKKSVNYTNAYSLSSYTSMSMGGLLSSRIPGELDRDGYFFGSYGTSNLFFPELLQKGSVKTMAAHAHGYFKGTGLDQGFDAWEIVPDLKWNNLTDENITSPKLEEIAEQLLGEPTLDKKKFFAWFHFVDPHDGYMAHEGIDWNGNKTMRDRYDVEVTFTDQYVGKLLDFVAKQSWGKRVVFIVTGDHGESFGEHKQFLHGFELWQNLIRVPLLFSVPGVAARNIDTNRSAIDIGPTILDLF